MRLMTAGLPGGAALAAAFAVAGDEDESVVRSGMQRFDGLPVVTAQPLSEALAVVGVAEPADGREDRSDDQTGDDADRNPKCELAHGLARGDPREVLPPVWLDAGKERLDAFPAAAGPGQVVLPDAFATPVV